MPVMKPSICVEPTRRKAVWGPKRSVAALFVLAFGFCAAGTPALAAPKKGAPAKSAKARTSKLDEELGRRKKAHPHETTSVIVRLAPGAKLPAQFKQFARANGRLNLIDGEVLDLPNRLIAQLEAHPDIFLIDHNRPIEAANERTAVAVGSQAVQKGYGLTGAGVGVAVIDSGIASWHDDLTNKTSTYYPYGNQRVAAFVDFVNKRTLPYDDEGHGTHVAGIIAGNGSSSGGRQAGIAPDASLVSLKVLDSRGAGTISNIIAALDWVAVNHRKYNIRVVNMSVGARVTQSYWSDPLTLAAKRVVDAGVVIVTTAGNRGKNALGEAQYGGITAPGNAPWVITVGASSTNGTGRRNDDTMASFSSRGPSYIDYAAKPDLVAPGHGTISLADPLSSSYLSKATYLVSGVLTGGFKPYLRLSGTSMAAPVVAGTAALMIQANPSLTPNAVKAILQYTAQEYPGFDPLTQGAGFLNTVGAIRLAKFFATAKPGVEYPVQKMWSRKLIWGNQRISGGLIGPGVNAWELGTTWGVGKQSDGDNIVWGTFCGPVCGDDNIVWGTNFDVENIVWGTHFDNADNIVWGTNFDENIVWGTDCGGFDCDDNIVWGTFDAADNIVWGTADFDDNIVWGTNLDENIVWGTNGDDNIVWGTSGDANIVWATGDDNIVWGTNLDENIVWGTDDFDNIVWGTAKSGSIQWGVPGTGLVSLLNWPSMLRKLSDEQIFNVLTGSLTDTVKPIVQPVVSTVTSTTTAVVTTTTSTTTNLLSSVSSLLKWGR
jgi:serine protease AprX